MACVEMMRLVCFIVGLIVSDVESFQGRQLMVLGDSNGTGPEGWVAQVKQLIPEDSVYNFSVSGNTIGFDNLNNPRLNCLKNLDRYFNALPVAPMDLDVVLIMLGTNDCKAVFQNRRQDVANNLLKLISKIDSATAADILLIAPPPYGPDEILLPKYHGGAACVASLEQTYRKIARQEGIGFVSVYAIFEEHFMNYSTDGVHLTVTGQKMIAETLVTALD